MKRNHILTVVVVILVMLLITTSIASAHGIWNPGVLPPNARVQGLTYGEWSARWWQYALSIPTPENPLLGAIGPNCSYQRVGRVLLVLADPLAGPPIQCEVPAGTILYFPIVNVECSTLEGPPFDGGNEAELRACALTFPIDDLQASIDGVPVHDLSQYIAASPLFSFTVPDDNILGAPGGSTGDAVANGAYLMIAPLKPGKHTISMHGTIGPPPDYPDSLTADMNIDLTVTPERGPKGGNGLVCQGTAPDLHCWLQINKSGFGDPNMGLVSSLAPFRGRIFASVSPDLLPTRPGVAQVWSLNWTGNWTPMMTDGFGNPNNFGINHIFPFKKQLYAATMNYTEGGEVWRTRDGVHWEQVASAGFGDPLMGEIFRFFEYQGQLYVSTVSYHPGDYGFELWRTNTGDAGDWTRVVANAFGNPLGYVLAVETEYDGYLYVGTATAGAGAEIWRTTDGETWEPVPFEFGAGIWSVDALAVYKGYLYAGTFETWPDVGLTGDRVFRCQVCDGNDWEQVVFDGFANTNNGYESALVVYHGKLYFVVGNPVEGLQVWLTDDGLAWEQVAWNGFGNPNNLNPYFSNSVTVIHGGLLIGTLNVVDGGQVWLLLQSPSKLAEGMQSQATLIQSAFYHQVHIPLVGKMR